MPPWEGRSTLRLSRSVPLRECYSRRWLRPRERSTNVSVSELTAPRLFAFAVALNDVVSSCFFTEDFRRGIPVSTVTQVVRSLPFIQHNEPLRLLLLGH